MPAVSKKQRKVMAIAEHHPEELYARNRGLAKMSKGQLHEFASTPEKGLPKRTKQLDRSTKGSVPFSNAELQAGFRCLGSAMADD